MRLLLRVSLLVLTGVVSLPVLAQYPNRPIRLVIPFPGAAGRSAYRCVRFR